MRRDAHSTQIKPVGIPASLNCNVGMSLFVGMTRTGPVQKSKLVVVKFERGTPKLHGKPGRPWTMLGIGDFVDPPRVVEDGKQSHDFDVGCRLLGQAETVFKHPCPVRHAMIALQRKGIVAEDRLQNGLQDHGDILPKTVVTITSRTDGRVARRHGARVPGAVPHAVTGDRIVAGAFDPRS